LLFVVADELPADAATGQLLRRLRAQHEILWLTVRDADLAPTGMETGDSHGTADAAGTADSYSVADSALLAWQPAASAAVAAAYATAVAQRDADRKAMLRAAGITEGEVAASDDVITGLFALLERHRRAG
jgi:hypothetical protein